MKESGIRIRISKDDKDRFKEVCDFEKVSMSSKLENFILRENLKDITSLENKSEYVINILSDGSVIVLDNPQFWIDENYNVFYDYNIELTHKMTATYNTGLKEFIEKIKVEKFLYT